MLITGFRLAMPFKNLMTEYFMVKGCQKDFTTREQRQLINATLHVAPLSLFEPLFPEVAVWLS